MFASRFFIVVLLACVFEVASAHAQPLNPIINPGASPIVVSQQPEKIAVRPTVVNRTLLNVAFGGVLMGGNTKSYAANLGFRFGLNRERHQLTLEALGSLGYSRQSGQMGEEPALEPTAQNTIARARYDQFVSASDALFVAMAPRHDSFAGLKLRLQNQVGYSRNFYAHADAHRLWGELGYDFTYDHFMEPEGESEQEMSMDDEEQKKSNNVHSARIFFGYTNHLSTTAHMSVGAETLLDFMDKDNVRVNGLAELTSSVTQSFKLGVQSRVMFDNVPAPDVGNTTDVIVAVQLVYTFDSSTVPATACPPCDCTEQVNAARDACRSEPVEPEQREGAPAP